MLQALELRDFVLVDAARLDLHPGLNVLSGETGAGKSLLVDALGLLTGVRAEAGLIRRGAERALVQAEFAGTTAPTSASRALVNGGRNHARLDGELVTVAELADGVGARVAVFAQHAQQALLAPRAQRDALDRLLEEDGRAARERWREAWRERADLQADLDALHAAARERLQRRDLLDLQLREIDEANPVAGEEDTLATEARRLRHVDGIRDALEGARGALDADDGALPALAAARRALDDAARLDADLEPLARDLRDAQAAASAILSELEVAGDRLDADPARLDAVERRIATLQRLFAKYGDGSAAVLAHREEVARERATLEADDARGDELAARIATLDAELETVGGRLTSARRAAADRFERDVAPLLERLALPGATLRIAVEPTTPGPHGADAVRFEFAANPGEAVAPLAQAASGGELSRVMLAAWTLSGSDRTTLVFDEVDAGVGGEAAWAVGELLASLADRHQVLIVTHLAQVAAHADHHVVVGKRERDARTVTSLTPLEGDEARERELARMLAGHDGDAARATARDLRARARAARTGSAA